jgi:hypothetical protein
MIPDIDASGDIPGQRLRRFRDDIECPSLIVSVIIS